MHPVVCNNIHLIAWWRALKKYRKTTHAPWNRTAASTIRSVRGVIFSKFFKLWFCVRLWCYVSEKSNSGSKILGFGEDIPILSDQIRWKMSYLLTKMGISSPTLRILKLLLHLTQNCTFKILERIKVLTLFFKDNTRIDIHLWNYNTGMGLDKKNLKMINKTRKDQTSQSVKDERERERERDDTTSSLTYITNTHPLEIVLVFQIGQFWQPQ